MVENGYCQFKEASEANMRLYRTWIFWLVAIVCLGFAATPKSIAQDSFMQRDLVNAGTVGIVSGGISGTYVRIASDLSNALDDGYDHRVLAILGKGSIRNIEDLLFLRGIDIAIVQSDVLEFYKSAGLFPGVQRQVNYITKLYNEEVHLVARQNIANFNDLKGRKVNFGTQGSGTFMTASVVFDALGVDVEVTTDPEPLAMEKLRTGEIDALVFVGGKPVTLLQQVLQEDDLKLLSVPLDRVKGPYLASTFTSDDYPALVPQGEEVSTVAVGAVLAAYNWAADNPRAEKVANFVARFFGDFDTFLKAPYHPKWKEVDIRSDLPGWQRLGSAQAWLAAHP